MDNHREALFDKEFENALSHLAQANYRVAAEYIYRHPERHQEIYDRLISAYGGDHRTPDQLAKMMQEELERINKEREQ